MSIKVPYLASPGVIPKVFSKMQEARRPERFTQDFLATKLGHSGGSAMAVIPLLKRMGFLASDSAPTQLYDQFRNQATRGAAVAAGMRSAYKEVFDRNEYAADLSKEKLQGLLMEVTGAAHDDRPLQLMVSTFLTLKALADFDAETDEEAGGEPEVGDKGPSAMQPPAVVQHVAKSVGLNVGYTINLNLPETTNPEVFNAIFKALKQNLLVG